MKNEMAEFKGELNFVDWEEKYLSYIDVADRTIGTYETGIRQFAKYLVEKGIKSPTRDDIIAFRDTLKEELKVSTVNSYLIALRGFFKFLEYNEVYKDITRNVKSLKDSDLHKRNALTIEQCKALLDSSVDLRERTLFLLIVSCGLRANEVVNIKIEDFKEESGKCLLYVLGKGRDYKQDAVVVPSKVLDLLKEYVKEYQPTDYLFYSTSNHNKGGKLSTMTIRRIINAMYERLGIKTDKIVVHSLRHTFGTLSIENGQEIREVSKAMRHKSVVVTERYLHDLEIRDNKCSSVVSSLLI